MGVVTASLVVNFGQEDQGILTAEIDDRATGYNGGETSFAPGETVAFLIYKTSNVNVNTPVVSLGAVAQIAGAQTLAKEEFLTFEDEKTATTSFPVLSGFTSTWLGNNLGSVNVTDQQTITAATKGVGVLRVNYNTQFTPWRLTNVPLSVDGLTAFPILIFVSGEIP